LVVDIFLSGIFAAAVVREEGEEGERKEDIRS
jgi:hypothetical protein